MKPIFKYLVFFGIFALTSSLPAKMKKSDHTSSSSSQPSSFSSGERNSEKPISPWISQKDGIWIYKCNVFNLDPDRVSQETLKSILEANIKDIYRQYRKEWGVVVDIKLYTGDQISNPILFQGDRIPFYVGPFDAEAGLGLHCIQATGGANTGFVVGGCNITDVIGVDVPDDFPPFTPWAVASTDEEAFMASIALNHNPYATSDLLQSLRYTVDGWLMTNNVTSNFFKAYYLSDAINWDKKGYVENPQQPFAGLNSILFLDYNSGSTFFGEVINWGPVTVSERGDPLANNFPPDYTYVNFIFSFDAKNEAKGPKGALHKSLWKNRIPLLARVK